MTSSGPAAVAIVVVHGSATTGSDVVGIDVVVEVEVVSGAAVRGGSWLHPRSAKASTAAVQAAKDRSGRVPARRITPIRPCRTLPRYGLPPVERPQGVRRAAVASAPMSALPTSPVRVRFAPSPTGYLHLGSARTALFNWLWVQHLRGIGLEAEMLLRIEDTDRERSQPELTEVIFESLRWLGIAHDGEPTHQSDRADRHDAAVEQLLASGRAYRCDCTQEQVTERHAAAGAGGSGYDRHCRDRQVPASAIHVVRFRVPDEGSTSWVDLIRGRISFEHASLEDFVLRRSDGTSVFLVANSVDDAQMRITHVIRGEDLINATPKMLLIRGALGYDEPIEFAHLPLIVNEARKKLSKRRDDVSVDSYRQRGFLPEAMVNYLALLGWGPPDGVEVRPLAEIVELFDIGDVNPSPAMFDVAKLESVNGDYLRAMTPAEFARAAMPYVQEADWYDPASFDPTAFEAIAPELQPRAKVLADVPAQVDFLFRPRPEVDPDSWASAVTGNADAAKILTATIDALSAVDANEWGAETLHGIVGGLAEGMGLKLGKFQAPVRVAVTGRRVGPPLFESIALLGPERTLERLREALAAC